MGPSIEAVRDARERSEFLKVPYRLYGKKHPLYVYPLLGQQKAFLDPEKNPFFRHADAQLWVARQGAMPVGRIAAAVDRSSNEYHGEQVGYFGFYEAPGDAEVATGLLETARAWIAGQGMTTMRGPGCFTTNHDALGLLVEGHRNRPAIGMPWQPPYYQEQLESFGLQKAQDLLAWQFHAAGGQPPARMARFARRIGDRQEFTVRPFRMDRFSEEVEIVRGLYYDAWKDNWGFVPMDAEEFHHAAKDMKSMVDPGFLLIAEAGSEPGGEPIGFSMTTPDFNQALFSLKGSLLPFGWLRFLLGKRRIRSARTLLMGVKPQYRRQGVDVMLVHETIRYAATRGIHTGECSWVLADNELMNRTLEKSGATRKNVYRIYERAV